MPEATLSTIKSLMKSTTGMTDEQITAQITINEEYIRKHCNREIADLTANDLVDEEYTSDAQRYYWITADGTDNYPWPILQIIADNIYSKLTYEIKNNNISSESIGELSVSYVSGIEAQTSQNAKLNGYILMKVI